MKRCERSEGRDVLVVGRRCHDAMAKRGAKKPERRIQWEEKSYSQERKRIKKRKGDVAEEYDFDNDESKTIES